MEPRTRPLSSQSGHLVPYNYNMTVSGKSCVLNESRSFSIVICEELEKRGDLITLANTVGILRFYKLRFLHNANNLCVC